MNKINPIKLFDSILSHDDVVMAANAINGNDANKILSDILKNKMQEINRLTGQDNDLKYFAYLLEYCIRTYGNFKEKH